MCLIDVKTPWKWSKKDGTCTSFDGLYAKIYVILTYSAFVGISLLLIKAPTLITLNKSNFSE